MRAAHGHPRDRVAPVHDLPAHDEGEHRFEARPDPVAVLDRHRAAVHDPAGPDHGAVGRRGDERAHRGGEIDAPMA
ncbi:MAG TPA: hypothetical protein VGC94_07115 [Amnibacterium sp.]